MRKELFKRHDGNPILRAEDWPYPVEAVYNPGATIFNNEVLLLVRVENEKGFSHLTVARSKNGKDDWNINPAPSLKADINFGEDKFGLEDPRITWLEELKRYFITCVAFRIRNRMEGLPAISLIATNDFVDFERISQPLMPLNKDAVLFSEKINGDYALMHRAAVNNQENIWISHSKDLVRWGNDRILFYTRAGEWDSDRIGLACQPLKTSRGWLVVYHGTRGDLYRCGLAMLDLKTLELTHRSEKFIFAPREQYERVGNKFNVVFPCGWILKEDNELLMYYGAADTCVCLATANLDEVLDFLMKCPVG